MRRGINLDMAGQRHPPGDNHKQDNHQLDDAQQVLQPQSPFHRRGVDEKRHRDTRQTDPPLIPPAHLDVRGVQDILAKHHAVTCGPA